MCTVCTLYVYSITSGSDVQLQLLHVVLSASTAKFRAEADSSHNHTQAVGTFLIAVSIAERLPLVTSPYTAVWFGEDTQPFCFLAFKW